MNRSNEPQKEWIEGCIQNDRRAQKALYEWSYPHLMSVSSRYSKNLEDAKSQANESFLKMLSHLKSYDPKRSFIPWMSTIAVRSAIDEYRKRKRDPLVFQDDQWHSQNEAQIDPDVIESLNTEHIESAIQGLKHSERMVFNLYVIEGYAHREVACMLNISERSSKRLFQKAKAELQTALAPVNKEWTSS